MSVYFGSKKQLPESEVFDGRLEAFGVYEHKAADPADRWLTDGTNFVWVCVGTNGTCGRFNSYGLNDPTTILRAIAMAFDTPIYSEHQPQYHGFETVEEWVKARTTLEPEKE
jgi:hypothetical protein